LHLQREIDSRQLDEDIFGSSETLLPALAHVPNLAATDCTVLITGETGTGTELVARAIHRLSYRSSRAFLRVNCAAIPPQVIASEQPGRQKDSWSQATQPRPDHFHLAKGGTIFLDGLGNLSAEAQIALMRFLQEIESQPTNCDDPIRSDVRLIATTDRDLRAAAVDGRFRSDLFDRINGFPIKISPLRERKEDIPMLAGYFLNRYATREGKTLPSLTKSTMDLLQSHPWPANMRELQWVMERFVSFYEAESISVGAKCTPRESISASHLLPVGIRRTGTNPKDLLEHALMEMLVDLLAGNLEPPVNGREYMNGEVDRSN
jgi:formate hydrogenlyase transcriptional activator